MHTKYRDGAHMAMMYVVYCNGPALAPVSTYGPAVISWLYGAHVQHRSRVRPAGVAPTPRFSDTYIGAYVPIYKYIAGA